MKIVKILGGLGNQMFQYALFMSLRSKFPDEEVKVDLSCFRGYPLHNGFELSEIFTLDFQEASWREVSKVAYPYPNYRCWQVGKYIMPVRETMCVEKANMAFDDTVLHQSGNRYYDGYWQHEEYFNSIRETVIAVYTFPRIQDAHNQKVIDMVSSQNSVSIHIRRGDYVNHPLFKGICGIDYYQSAINYMNKNVAPDVYCLFSNDIEWCWANLADMLPPSHTIYVDWNKGKQSYVDMQIMSNCKHNIVANSSFSWWGAWLNQNPDKIVIAPHKWTNANIHDPVPSNWIRI